MNIRDFLVSIKLLKPRPEVWPAKPLDIKYDQPLESVGEVKPTPITLQNVKPLEINQSIPPEAKPLIEDEAPTTHEVQSAAPLVGNSDQELSKLGFKKPEGVPTTPTEGQINT